MLAKTNRFRMRMHASLGATWNLNAVPTEDKKRCGWLHLQLKYSSTLRWPIGDPTFWSLLGPTESEYCGCQDAGKVTIVGILATAFYFGFRGDSSSLSAASRLEIFSNQLVIFLAAVEHMLGVARLRCSMHMRSQRRDG